MRINLMTVGQSVKVTAGKYAGHRGEIVKAYTMADSNGVGNYFRVRVQGTDNGKKTYTPQFLAVYEGSK